MEPNFYAELNMSHDEAKLPDPKKDKEKREQQADAHIAKIRPYYTPTL